MAKVSLDESKFDSDVCILGAGLAGSSLGNMLLPASTQNWRIQIFDKYTLPNKSSSNQHSDTDAAVAPMDGRATALSYGSRQLLEDIDVWTSIQNDACPIHHIEVSDHGHFGQAHLHAKEQGTEALGYIIRNQHLGTALQQPLIAASQQQNNFQLTSGVEITAVTPINEGVCCQLADGSQHVTRLLVVADGGRSPLLSQLGIHRQQTHYDAHAIVTQVKTNQEHQHWAYERFSQHGPLAFLPLDNHHYAVVWTVATDKLDEVMGYSEQEFLAQLQRRIGYRVGCLTEVGERSEYPLALITASEQVRPNIVLLGNAAHALHPVAGQGFNLTLRDTARLAQTLLQARQQQESPGSLSVLNRYHQAAIKDQQITIVASDWLPRLFGQSGQWLQRSRDIGLLTLAATPTVRRLFTRQAMGFGQPAVQL